MNARTQTQAQPLMSDYEVGYKSYWLGHGDSRCGNQEQMRGWWDANKADTTPLPGMHIDGVDNEFVLVGEPLPESADGFLYFPTYNAYGDIVR